MFKAVVVIDRLVLSIQSFFRFIHSGNLVSHVSTFFLLLVSMRSQTSQ